MKISTALDKIDEHQLFVPAFQREYVWKKDDAKQLIDSLIKDYPTGTMLTWETKSPPEIKGDKKYDEMQGAVRILLDGQQRLTTLYMLVRGTVPPYYSDSEILSDPRGLYVNVETLELEYYSTKKMSNNPRWQDITNVFQKKVRARDIVKALKDKGEEVSEEQDDRLDDHARAIENILDRDFPEQTVPIRATVQEAIDIFYKVNASGVSLTEAELALAQISGYWPEARDIFKTKIMALQEKGFIFKLDFIVYVLLGCLHHLGSDMRKLHAPENNEPLRNVWKQLDEQVLDYVTKVMRSHAYVDHTDEINSVYALIPIIVYCFNKKEAYLDDIEINKIVKWFYYSQIRTRYTSQLPQKLDRDLRIVNEEKNPFDELLAVIEEERHLTISPDEFVGRSISHPLFGLIRWYLKSKEAICFTTGVKLRQDMGEKYELKNHPIFPYSKLKAKGYGHGNRFKYSLGRELTNRVILTEIDKDTKSMTDAKDYLAKVVSKSPGALSLQCVPEDPQLWEIDNYEKFLKTRREMLAEELNIFLEGITNTKPPEASLTLEDLIAEGEGEELEFKSSLRWDIKDGKKNKSLEDVVVKTIAAFLNAQGGTLLIGVDDNQKVIGLEHDYRTLGKANRDAFELHLRNIFNKNFNTSFVTTNIQIAFPQVGETEICQIDIKSADKPVYISLKDKQGQIQEKFYLRSGNLSSALSMSETQEYISKRFTS